MPLTASNATFDLKSALYLNLVGRLDKGPSKVVIAALGVAAALALAFADPFAADTTALRRIAPDAWKATNRSGLQDNR